MGFIDYSRIGVPSYSQDIKGIGDALFESMAFRAKQNSEAKAMAERERHDRALEVYNQQIAANAQEREKRLDDIAIQHHQATMNDRSIAAAKEAGQALGHGDTGMYGAILAGNGITDAVTNPLPKPTAPVAPTFGPEPTAPSFPEQRPEPMPSPAGRYGTRQVPVEGPMPLSPDQQLTFGNYQNQIEGYRSDKAKKEADFEKAQTEYPGQLDTYERGTTHNLTLPNGQKVAMNESELRYGARTKDAQDLRTNLGGVIDTHIRQASILPEPMRSRAIGDIQRQKSLLDQHIAAVMGGGEKPEIAFKQWDSDVREGTKEARIVSEGAANRANQLEKQRIANQRPSIAMGQRIQEGGLALREEEGWNHERDDFEKRYDLPKDMIAYRNLNAAASHLKSNNPELQSAVQFAIARSLQGVGPLTDRDIDRLNANPGVGGKLQNMVQQWQDGTLGDDTKQVLTEATKRLVQVKQNNVKIAQKAYQNYYSSDLPYLGRFGKGFLDKQANLLFGGAEMEGPGAPQGTPDVKPRSPGQAGIHGSRSKSVKASGSAAEPGNPILDALMEYAQ